MSKDFQTIFVTVRPPRDGDCGVVEQGYFRTEDDNIVLVNKDGVARLNKKGKRLEYKLKPLRDHLPNRREGADFNRTINYPTWRF